MPTHPFSSVLNALLCYFHSTISFTEGIETINLTTFFCRRVVTLILLDILKDIACVLPLCDSTILQDTRLIAYIAYRMNLIFILFFLPEQV